MWFLIFRHNFFYTYNHTGGVLLLVYMLYCAFRYIKDRDISHIYFSLMLAFLLCLVKLNFGIVALCALLVSIYCIDFHDVRTKKISNSFLYLKALTVIPVIVFMIYYVYLQEVSWVAIRQCFPFLSSDHPYSSSIAASLRTYLEIWAEQNLQTHAGQVFSAIAALSILHILVSLFSKRNDKREAWNIYYALMTCVIFFLFCLHEFLLSNIPYRSLWSEPFLYVAVFLLLGFSIKRLPNVAKILLFVALSYIIGSTALKGYLAIEQNKTPDKYLSINRAKIYVNNAPAWIKTVTATTNYLEKNLKFDETFLAIPYDPLYYFLTGKDSPELIFSTIAR